MIYTITKFRNSRLLKSLMYCGFIMIGVVGTAKAANFGFSISNGISASTASTTAEDQNSAAAQQLVEIELKIIKVTLSDQNISSVDPTLFEQYGSLSAGLDNAYINTMFDDFESVEEILSQNGEIKTVSTLMIQVRNNQKALIQDADQEYFYTGFDNSATPSVVASNDDKEAFLSGLSLGITPYINGSQEILLRVNPRVSKVNSVNRIVDGIGVDLVSSMVRESDSVIKVDNGRITVLGGLVFERGGNEIVILLKPGL